MLRLVIGFLPWIILAVLGNRWFALALVLALAAAAVTTVRQVRGRSLKILDTITFAFFLFVPVGVVGFRWMTLATYMSLLANATLTAIAWGSLLAGAPFTIQYAREQVAPEFWHSPLFIRTNQHITAVWGLDFFLSALGFALPAGFGRPEPGVAVCVGSLFAGRGPLHGLFPGLVPGSHAAPRGGERARVTFATTSLTIFDQPIRRVLRVVAAQVIRALP